MTTGRINQVTTFQSAFAAIVYSRVTSTRFRDAEFIITFLCVLKIHCSSTDDMGPRARSLTTWASSNVEPANGIASFPILAHPKRAPLFPVVGNKGSPTYGGDYRRPMTPERRANVDVADPQVVKLRQV
jgi:hypothetical protein